MGAPHWGRREPADVFEEAMVHAALFAAVARRLGDMSNYYRWRMVLHDIRVAVNAHSMNGDLFVAC